jgi:DegV family protein with EDD domain
MPKIEIVTDSASSLPPDAAEKHGISVVPVCVQIGDKSYRDGVDLSPGAFYASLDGPQMPTTSSPPPNEFIQVYRRLAQRAKDIISIHITADGSATCQVAALAAESVPEADVTVYDSKGVSMGTGFLAIEAAKAALQGLRKDEILSKLDSLRGRMHTFVAIPTLKYLRRSGRVRQGQAILASLLSVKPVLEVKDGMVKVVGHVRTFSNAVSRILDLAANAAGNLPAVVAVMHANAKTQAEAVAEAVKKRLNVRELVIGDAGTALAVHGGPGMIGIVLYTLNPQT